MSCFVQQLEKFICTGLYMQPRTSTWDCLTLLKSVVSLLFTSSWRYLTHLSLNQILFFFLWGRTRTFKLTFLLLLYSNCSDSLTSVNHLSKLLLGDLLYFNYGTVIMIDKKWKSSLLGITITVWEMAQWLGCCSLDSFKSHFFQIFFCLHVIVYNNICNQMFKN